MVEYSRPRRVALHAGLAVALGIGAGYQARRGWTAARYGALGRGL